MYRLLAPGPSSLVEGWPASCGKNPSMSLKATCSMRYRPSVPLEFASPCGNSRVRELKRIRMDSTMDAPRTTVFPYASYSSLRSEEHTSELQSPCNLVCRLLLEKKKVHCILHRPSNVGVTLKTPGLHARGAFSTVSDEHLLSSRRAEPATTRLASEPDLREARVL